MLEAGGGARWLHVAKSPAAPLCAFGCAGPRGDKRERGLELKHGPIEAIRLPSPPFPLSRYEVGAGGLTLIPGSATGAMEGPAEIAIRNEQPAQPWQARQRES